MRKLSSIIISLAFIFGLISPALAAEQGDPIYRYIVSGYYAMFKDGSGQWVGEEQPGVLTPVNPGDTRPANVGRIGSPVNPDLWKITDVKVKQGSEVTSQMFDKNTEEGKKTGIWRSDLDYPGFINNYIIKSSGSIVPNRQILNESGDINLSANVLLGPPEKSVFVAASPAKAKYYANTTWAPDSSAVLWTVPLIVEWYGTQKTPPPAGGTNNPPDSNLPNNLSVKITNTPSQVYSGDPIAVTAEIKNTLKQYVITDYRWKVNGNVVKDYNNFDVISSQQNTYTMTAPDVTKPTTITFTTEVNYNHSKPPTESTWEDNIATCTVTVLPHPVATSGDLNMWIEAPASVSNSPLPKPWTFTVWVKPPSIPAPPPPPPDSDSPPPPPPKLTISVITTGGLRGDHYEYSTGQQDIEPIEPTYSGRKTVSYEDTSPIPFTFTFPWSGVWGQETQVHIKATGSLTSWCGSWSGQAQKDVKIGEVPIPGKSQILTK